MVIHAYVGWVDRGEPQIYFTENYKEAQQGLMRTKVTSCASTQSGHAKARQRAHDLLIEKWSKG